MFLNLTKKNRLIAKASIIGIFIAVLIAVCASIGFAYFNAYAEEDEGYVPAYIDDESEDNGSSEGADENGNIVVKIKNVDHFNDNRIYGATFTLKSSSKTYTVTDTEESPATVTVPANTKYTLAQTSGKQPTGYYHNSATITFTPTKSTTKTFENVPKGIGTAKLKKGIRCSYAEPYLSSGKTYSTFQYTIDGITAYCAQPPQTSPSAASYDYYNVDIIGDSERSALLRKILYYSKNYDGFDKNIWPEKYYNKTSWDSENKYYTICTHILLAYVYSNYDEDNALYRTGYEGHVNYTDWLRTNILVNTLNNIKEQADPPTRFNAFILHNKSDNTSQDMIFGTYTGGLKILKNLSTTPKDIGAFNPNDYSLAGAEYTIYSDSGCTTKVTTITTDKNGYAYANNLHCGTSGSRKYYIKETKAAKNMSLDTKTYTVTVTKNKDATKFTEQESVETPQVNNIGVAVYKKDTETKKGLQGAIFRVTIYGGNYTDEATAKQSGANSRTWHLTTDENGQAKLLETYKAEGYQFDELFKNGTKVCLPVGTVFVEEIEAPQGYIRDSEIKRVRIEGDTEGGSTIDVYNAPEVDDNFTQIEVDKLDINKHDTFINGAKLEIWTQNTEGGKGELVTSWTQGESKGQIINRTLNPNQTYILHETYAPAPYLIADDVTFTVNDSGELQKIEMFDKPTEVALSKKGVTGENELVGAWLVLSKWEDGVWKVIENWQSQAEPHVAKYLYPGQYQLKETEAPNGYDISEPIEFTLNDDGSVTGSTTMKDKLKISKLGVTGENELAGAHLQLISKTSQTIIEEWDTTTEGSHTIDSLDPGEYIIRETSAPNGYALSADVEFTLNVDATITGSTKMEDKLQISKKGVTGQDELPGAFLVLSKIREDLTPVVIDHWQTVSGSPKTIDKLDPGVYELSETTAPKGYKIADAITFTLNEDGSITGSTTMNNSLSISKRELTGEDELEGAELKLYKVDTTPEQEIEGWTSTATPHIVSSLQAGKYELRETKAPVGYKISDPVAFTLSSNGAIVENEDIIMKDSPVTVPVSKKSITGENELPGASLELYKINDGQEKLIDSWISDKTPHVVEKLTAGDYKIVETAAPKGYDIASPVEFSIDDQGQIIKGTTTMRDTPNSVPISKKAVTGEDELEGAELELYLVKDEGEELIGRWTSGKEAKVFENLKSGNYILKETKAPKGYALADPVKFFVKEGGKVDTPVNMYDDLKISKQGVTGEKELPGAELALYKIQEDGNWKFVSTWTSKSEPHTVGRDVGGLKPGNYVLQEVKAPNGYAIASPVYFTLNSDGTIENEIVMHNNLQLSKKGVTGQEELVDTDLELWRGDAQHLTERIIKWTTDGTPKTVENLTPGIYTLKETRAPKGYTLAEPVTFTLNEDGTVSGNTYIEDKLKISKYDASGSTELEGAHFALYKLLDSKETFVTDWYTQSTPTEIQHLEPGDYVLQEVEAPDGFTINKPVSFSLDKAGNIINGETVMYDNPNSIPISKKEVGGTDELPGAKLQLTKEGVTDPIDTWVSGEEAHIINGLISGKYTLTELEAPDGYDISSPVTFELDKAGNVISGSTTMYDSPNSVSVSKKEVGGTDELPGAKLQLTKEGVTEPIDTWVSGSSAHIVHGLKSGTYTLTELEAPAGYTIADPIVFKLDKTGTIVEGEAVMYNSKTQLTIDKLDLIDSRKVIGAHLQLYNSDGSLIAEWDSGNEAKLFIGLTTGQYTLHETYAPDGYLIAEDVEITVTDENIIQKAVMYDDVTKIAIQKKDYLTKKAIAGATFQLWSTKGSTNLQNYDLDGQQTTNSSINIASETSTNSSSNEYILDKIVDTWVSTEEPHYTLRLPFGTYVLKEVNPPEGWLLGPDVVINLNEESSQEIIEVEQCDDYTKLEIVKRDVSTGANLECAHLQLQDENGNVVADFITATTPYRIDHLNPGTYWLVEVDPPTGYQKADNVKVVVEETGEIQKAFMDDCKIPETPKSGDNTAGLMALLVMLATFGCGIAYASTRLAKSRRK